MKKTIILILLVALMILAGTIAFFILNKRSDTSNLPKVENQNNGQNTQPNNPDNTGQDNSSSSQEQVSVKGFVFNPSLVEIKVGSMITWTNEDVASHTIVFSDFQSQKISQGQNFSHVFDKAGSFDYFCSLHPSMQGKVIVKP